MRRSYYKPLPRMPRENSWCFEAVEAGELQEKLVADSGQKLTD